MLVQAPDPKELPAPPKVKNEEVKNPPKDVLVVAPAPTPVPTPTPVPVPTPATDPIAMGYSDRTVLTKERLDHSADQIKVEFWDQTIIDGDVITVTWNGRLVLDHYQVKREHKVLMLDLQKGDNLLVMHAENLGRIPPNTAAVAVYRTGTPEVYTLNSDLGKSEAIRITRD